MLLFTACCREDTRPLYSAGSPAYPSRHAHGQRCILTIDTVRSYGTPALFVSLWTLFRNLNSKDKTVTVLLFVQMFFRRTHALTWVSRDVSLTVGINRCTSKQARNIFPDGERMQTVTKVSITVLLLQSRSYRQVPRCRVLEDLQCVRPVGAEGIKRLFLTVRGESCPLNLKRQESWSSPLNDPWRPRGEVEV